MEKERLKQRILAARGKILPDLVLKGGMVVDLFTGRIEQDDVAIHEGHIVGVGAGYRGRREVDLRGKWILPGLMDAHIHMESSMLAPPMLAGALLVHGTTTIVADPHEIANVMGLEGVRFMLEQSEGIPFDVFVMAPSCVPATNLETAGGKIGPRELQELLEHPRVLGLAEMMNFPGVLETEDEVLEKILLFRGKAIDGHCPSLRGRELQAYVSAGIRSDHEATRLEEALEKLKCGMMVMIREGSSAKNLEDLLPLVMQGGRRRTCFVSDDLHAEDIARHGHLDFLLRKSVALGLDPISAIRQVSINPAEHYGLNDRGAVAPGYRADLTVVEDLKDFQVVSVYKDGRLVVEDGQLVDLPRPAKDLRYASSRPLNMAPMSPEDFRIPHGGGKARIIELIPGQIITKACVEKVPSDHGNVTSQVQCDILKLAVVERHHASGRCGLGLVRGFGLKRGALASSVAHDSHNVIAVGVSDQEIFRAVEEVRLMGGGLAVVIGDKALATTPLQIAGLMSREPPDILVRQLEATKKSAANELGCAINEPFMALSFLALPVIPELKLTDRGLVDVNRFTLVPIFSGS